MAKNAVGAQIHVEDRRIAEKAGDESAARPFVKILRRADLRNAAGVHHRDPVRQNQRLALIMRYIDRGQAEFGMKAPPEGLKRIRNLRENPRVSIVIDEYDDDWSRLRYVIIQGQADLLTDGPQFAHGVDLLVAKYAQYRTLGLPRERGLMIRVTPRRVSSWQYSS